VLHFRPVRYERFSQALELTSGEQIPGQPPLLKCRKEITREQAIELWSQKRRQRRGVVPGDDFNRTPKPVQNEQAGPR
jgi:hypothetical protein